MEETFHAIHISKTIMNKKKNAENRAETAQLLISIQNKRKSIKTYIVGNPTKQSLNGSWKW